MAAGRHRSQPSDGSSGHAHQPAQPSTLRQSHTPSSRPTSYVEADDDDGECGADHAYFVSPSAARGPDASESSPLLVSSSSAHPGECDHGTFSPRASNSIMGQQEIERQIDGLQGSDDWKTWLKQRMRTKKMGDSSELAQRAGVDDGTIVYEDQVLSRL